MTIPKNIETQNKKPNFITIELRGGPDDGQSMRVPDDQTTVTLRHGETQHIYHRLNKRPVMHHTSVAVRAFGGAK